MKTMAYVAKCKCGGIVMACMDDGKHNDDIASEVSDCIKSGLTIERVGGEIVRNAKWCDCKEASK